MSKEGKNNKRVYGALKKAAAGVVAAGVGVGAARAAARQYKRHMLRERLLKWNPPTVTSKEGLQYMFQTVTTGRPINFEPYLSKSGSLENILYNIRHELTKSIYHTEIRTGARNEVAKKLMQIILDARDLKLIDKESEELIRWAEYFDALFNSRAAEALTSHPAPSEVKTIVLPNAGLSGSVDLSRFVNLTHLDVSGNTDLTSIDIPSTDTGASTKLKVLDVRNTGLSQNATDYGATLEKFNVDLPADEDANID